jgi:hypothetical protein
LEEDWREMDLLSKLSDSPMFLTKAGRRYLRMLYTIVDGTGRQDDRIGIVVSLALMRDFLFFTTGVYIENKRMDGAFSCD